MKIKKGEIKRILLITLTNLGDIILTTPIISVLEKEFPEARLDIMCGPAGRDIFISHPRVFKVIIYNKHLPLQEKRRLVRKLKMIRYDLVIDLKNSLFPILIGARYHTSPIQPAPGGATHKKELHLSKLESLGIKAHDAPFSVFVEKKDEDYVETLLARVENRERLVAVSPTSKSLIKRWKKPHFARLCERLMKELDVPLVFVGDHADRDAVNEIMDLMDTKPLNFTGLTTVPQLAHLLKKSRLVITNDSAPLHVASAVGANIIAIFGPTDPHKYGPRGSKNIVIRKDLPCSPCEAAQCRYKHECMWMVTVDEVYSTAKDMLR